MKTMLKIFILFCIYITFFEIGEMIGTPFLLGWIGGIISLLVLDTLN